MPPESPSRLELLHAKLDALLDESDLDPDMPPTLTLSLIESKGQVCCIFQRTVLT